MRGVPAGPGSLTERRHGAAERVSVLGGPPLRLHAIFLLLLVSAVAWRKGVYYSGGLDVVVMAKAAMSMLALALALTVPAPRHSWSQLRATPVVWLAGYLLVATVGGLLFGSPQASLILVARLAILAAVLVLAVRAYPWSDVVSALLTSMLVLGLFAAATGVGTLADGELSGGLPPLNPNEISLLLTVPLIAVLWLCLNGVARGRDAVLVPLLFGVIWATGSRTGLAALVFALLLMVALAGRIPVPVFAAAMVAIPVLVFVAGWTPVLSTFLLRDDTASLGTLNSRTVAWSAAAQYADSLGERLLGAGLALKVIPVSAMYRDQQILDSTWVSALLQVGIVGVAVLALFVLSTLVRAWAAPRPQRSLFVAVLAYAVTVSLMESGLFDTSVLFIVFFTFALCACGAGAPRRTGVAGRAGGAA